MINVRADNLTLIILTSAYQQWEITVVATDQIFNQNIVVGGRLIYTFLFLNPNPFRVLDPYICKRVNFTNFQKAKLQVTSRSQMSNRVQKVPCDLSNPSDLHCQLNVGLIVTDWGFADFYTVILTRSWLNNPKLDPDPGLWWVLAVINVRADNLSQNQFPPLATNSERNQSSQENWFNQKHCCRGNAYLYFPLS